MFFHPFMTKLDSDEVFLNVQRTLELTLIAGIHCHLRSCPHGVTLFSVFACISQAMCLSVVVPLLLLRLCIIGL